MSDVNAMLREYVTVSNWAQRLTKRKSELRARIQQYMEERELESLTGEDGMGASFVDKPVHVSVKVEDRDRMIEWLQASGNGSIIQEQVKDGDLRRVVQEYLDRGEPVPEFFKVWPEPGFQVRSGKYRVPDLPATL